MTPQDVIAQMEAVGLGGLSAFDLKIDSAFHYFKPDFEKKKYKKRGWYVLKFWRLKSGAEYIVGNFGCFYGADTSNFSISLPKHVSINAEESARFKRECEQQAKIKAAEEAKLRAQCAEESAATFASLPVEGGSPYLTRKKVRAFGLRFSRGSIVIPLVDMAGKIHGLQFIAPNGDKKFKTGTAKKGHFFVIGAQDAPPVIAFAEGYATAASIHQCTGWMTVVAFDAGNLLPVAEAFRPQFPAAAFVFCGDDDAGSETNTGRVKADEAAARVGGVAVFPEFDMQEAA